MSVFRLTKQQLRNMRPCNPETRLEKFGKSSSLSVRQALNRGFTIRDVLWVAGQLGFKKQCVEFARWNANSVKHLRNRYAADAAYAAAYAADAYAAAYAAADAADAAAYAAVAAARQEMIERQKKELVRIFAHVHIEG